MDQYHLELPLVLLVQLVLEVLKILPVLLIQLSQVLQGDQLVQHHQRPRLAPVNRGLQYPLVDQKVLVLHCSPVALRLPPDQVIHLVLVVRHSLSSQGIHSPQVDLQSQYLLQVQRVQRGPQALLVLVIHCHHSVLAVPQVPQAQRVLVDH